MFFFLGSVYMEYTLLLLLLLVLITLFLALNFINLEKFTLESEHQKVKVCRSRHEIVPQLSYLPKNF